MIRILILAVVLALTFAFAVAEDGHPTPPKIDDPRFDFLKELAGEWTGDALREGMPEGRFEFRVTAGGTAVEEREMIGTPMEMLTVYHMEGKNLVATHYCMLGNQPSMVAAKRIVDNTLTFACNGKPGNAKSHDDMHVHGWSMRLDDEGRLHYDAELIENGATAESPSVILTRQTKTAGR